MKKEEIERNIKEFCIRLKEEFGKSNIKIVDNGHNENLFLIRVPVTKDSITVNTALVIKICPGCSKSGESVFHVVSYYGYPNLSREDEASIIAKAGEILESTISPGFVICESGDVKVSVNEVKKLSEIFKDDVPSRAV